MLTVPLHFRNTFYVGFCSTCDFLFVWGFFGWLFFGGVGEVGLGFCLFCCFLVWGFWWVFVGGGKGGLGAFQGVKKTPPHKTQPNNKKHQKTHPKTWYQKGPNLLISTCVPSDVQQMDIYSNPLLQKSAEELFALPKLPMPYLALTRLHLSKCRHSADVASNGAFLESG